MARFFGTSTKTHILQLLAKCELTGYEITMALKEQNVGIEDGDGFLYPILYLMEIQKRISSEEITTRKGTVRRVYKITPWGMMDLDVLEKRMRACMTEPESEESAEDTEDPLEEPTAKPLDETALRTYAADATAGIRSRHVRESIAAEVEAHIADALAAQGGNLNAKAIVASQMGDPARIGKTLRELSSSIRRRPRISRKVWIGCGVTLLVAAALGILAYFWGVFVAECLAIAAAITVLVCLIKFTRVYTKRRRAYKNLTLAAEARGYTICKHQSVLSSIYLLKDTPAISIQTEKTIYKIRFMTVWKKTRILKFRTPYLYQLTTKRGVAMVRTHVPGTWIYFKPKGMTGHTLKLYHTYLVDFDSSLREIPLFDKREDDPNKKQVEVLLLNPAPLRATIAPESADVLLVGGESFRGVIFHDAPGFCEYIRRLK